jgi:hypothetical protein
MVTTGSFFGRSLQQRTWPVGLAREKRTDWFNEIEARIENIQAKSRGAGRTLTQARALSGFSCSGLLGAKLQRQIWLGSRTQIDPKQSLR